jgi:predicted 3-demethylubiquinone-9 3-methyltransferase (glyoxalase superfamily)
MYIQRTGIPCHWLNGGPEVKHNGAFSFQVAWEQLHRTAARNRKGGRLAAF